MGNSWSDSVLNDVIPLSTPGLGNALVQKNNYFHINQFMWAQVNVYWSADFAI